MYTFSPPSPPPFVVSELQLLEVKCVVKKWNFEIKPVPSSFLNPSCTKVFGTHTIYEGGWGGGWEEGEPTPPVISKTLDSTSFNFGRSVGLSMRGKNKMVQLIM